MLTSSAFAVILPDNLFLGANPTATVLAVHRTTGLAAVLLAEVTREQAKTKGATGRATVERTADGSYRVVAIADKGKGRFDAGSERERSPRSGGWCCPPAASSASRR